MQCAHIRHCVHPFLQSTHAHAYAHTQKHFRRYLYLQMVDGNTGVDFGGLLRIHPSKMWCQVWESCIWKGPTVCLLTLPISPRTSYDYMRENRIFFFLMSFNLKTDFLPESLLTCYVHDIQHVKPSVFPFLPFSHRCIMWNLLFSFVCSSHFLVFTQLLFLPCSLFTGSYI